MLMDLEEKYEIKSQRELWDFGLRKREEGIVIICMQKPDDGACLAGR